MARWYDFGMGALGDWGHTFWIQLMSFWIWFANGSKPNLSERSQSVLFSHVFHDSIQISGTGKYACCRCNVAGWMDNIPSVPENYGVSELDLEISDCCRRAIQPAALNPGKEIYTKTLTFKGGSHGSTCLSSLDQVAKDLNPTLRKFRKAHPTIMPTPVVLYGKREARSPFSGAGPLSQVFCLGLC